MQLGLIGLGRMGANIARRLAKGGHHVAIYNRTSETTKELGKEDPALEPVFSYAEMVQKLAAPRVIWLMVPAGQVTENILLEIADLLSPGDTIIDGGNANFHDSRRRGEMLAARNIQFLDIGVSGGVWGLKEGFSLMIGGDANLVKRLEPIFQTLAPAPDQGWGWVGPHGAGHYVKMVHNGIEYGMMEALAEGFELVKTQPDFGLDVAHVAEIWQFGSVVRSWLLDLTADALRKNPNLDGIKPWVADSGEGRWTVEEAIHQSVPAPVIAISLFRRFASQQGESYSDKLLAAMRNEFGGHEIHRE